MRDAYGPLVLNSGRDINEVPDAELMAFAFAAAHRCRALMARSVDSKRHPLVHGLRRDIRRRLVRAHMESLHLALNGVPA